MAGVLLADERQTLGIALTDTFGTPAFLEAFKKPIPEYTIAGVGSEPTRPSGDATTTTSVPQSLAETKPPITAPIEERKEDSSKRRRTYAEVFQGVRQDSGDPAHFVKMVRDFYDSQNIRDKKSIVFSDSLNVDLCLEYKVIAEEAGFQPIFGVGTFLTSTFHSLAASSLPQKHRLIESLQMTLCVSPTRRNPCRSISSSKSPRPAVDPLLS